MNKNLAILLFILVFSAFSIAAQTPLDGKWKLVSMNLGKNSSLPGKPITLNIDKDRIGGNGGCNSYGGNFSLIGQTVNFSQIFSTKMWCENSPTENQYFQALGKSLHFRIKGEQLILTDADKQNSLRFERNEVTKSKIVTMYVQPKQINCETVTPQKCFIVKYAKNQSYQRFYEAIEGFNFKKGYWYLLEVEQIRKDVVPKDTSLYEYKLVKILKKSKKSF